MPLHDRLPGRETRLVILIIAVSIGTLLLLAQFRFPPRPRPAPPVTPPLQAIAARATYEELAESIHTLHERIAPALLVLRLRPGGTQAGAGDPSLESYVPAVRIRENLALALLPPGVALAGRVREDAPPPVLFARDPRGVSVVRAEAPPGSFMLSEWELDPVSDTGRYVAVVEGSPGGPLLRPLFLARARPIDHAAWQRPLAVLGPASTVEEGALVFSLQGLFIGLVVHERGVALMVQADSVIQAFEALARSPSAPMGALGVGLQPLTTALSRATSASHGAMVADVDPEGPASQALRPGDVIQAIDGRAVYSPASLEARLAMTAPGTTVRLRVVRGGAATNVEATIGRREQAAAAADSVPDLGLSVVTARGRGSRVTHVRPDSAAGRAGLRAGDVITRIGGSDAPTAADLRRAFAEAAPDSALLAGVQRDGRHLMVALEKR